MDVELDQTFLNLTRNIAADLKQHPEINKKKVACYLRNLEKNVETDQDRQVRNECACNLLRTIKSGENLSDEIYAPEDVPCINYVTPSSSSSIDDIQNLIQEVNNGRIKTAAEFIFYLTTFVSDQGVALREILEKDLNLFREIVEEIISHRIQDEADVMMHTQNDIKQKLKSFTNKMIQRTLKIKEQLQDISPKFDWISDGKDRAKISKLFKTEKKQNMIENSSELEKEMHQICIRGQWFKKELNRLLEENATLENFLKGYQKLAIERKAWESQVPKMLCEQKKKLEKKLRVQKRKYKMNMEIIDALYIEHQRCLKPSSESYE